MGRETFDSNSQYLIYGEESSYATGATPSVGNHLGRVTAFNSRSVNNVISSRGVGEGPNRTSINLGNFAQTGTITCKPIDLTFLQYGVGYRDGLGTDASPYLIKEANKYGYTSTDNKTITLELGGQAATDTQVNTFPGTVFDSWTLNGREGAELEANVSFTAKSMARATSIETYTAPTGRTYVFNSGSVQWNSEELSLTQFSVTCNSAHIPVRELFSDRLMKQPQRGARTYNFTLTMNMNFDDTASTISSVELLDEFFQASNSPLDAGAPTTRDMVITISEGSASGDKVAIIQLEECIINDWSKAVSTDGGPVQITCTGTATAGKDESGDKVPLKFYTIA